MLAVQQDVPALVLPSMNAPVWIRFPRSDRAQVHEHEAHREAEAHGPHARLAPVRANAVAGSVVSRVAHAR